MPLLQNLRYEGKTLDTSPDSLGFLSRADDALADRSELRRRMERDGYLYFPALLERDEVLDARREAMKRLAASGALEPGTPLMEAVARNANDIPQLTPALARDNEPLDRLLYGGKMMAFYEFFLDGPIRHFDYTWLRTKMPGPRSATHPHCDIVYMGRGTGDLFTSWTPLGDIPFELGGLMILENSHQLEELRDTYGQTDVDLYCENEGDAAAIVTAARQANRPLEDHERASIHWNSTGSYADDALAIREELGGRWLTAEYQIGDLLIFGMYTMHTSADNQTDRIRISSDSRYQLASEPADERWIGEDPPAHGIRAKRGMIC